MARSTCACQPQPNHVIGRRGHTWLIRSPERVIGAVKRDRCCSLGSFVLVAFGRFPLEETQRLSVTQRPPSHRLSPSRRYQSPCLFGGAHQGSASIQWRERGREADDVRNREHWLPVPPSRTLRPHLSSRGGRWNPSTNRAVTSPAHRACSDARNGGSPQSHACFPRGLKIYTHPSPWSERSSACACA